MKEFINIQGLISELDRIEFTAKPGKDKLIISISKQLIISLLDEIASIEKLADDLDVKFRNKSEECKALKTENICITAELHDLAERLK